MLLLQLKKFQRFLHALPTFSFDFSKQSACLLPIFMSHVKRAPGAIIFALNLTPPLLIVRLL